MFIPRPGAQLHTLSFGQGPLTLLAVGGWTAGGEIWHPLFGHLPHWRCISVDHRGAGASTRSGPITVDDMADDLLAVADALNVGPCVLAAESSGAAAALRAVQRAQQHAPHRFAGLVLIGPAWQRTEPGAADNFIAALRRDHTSALRAFIDSSLPETDSAELKRWGLQMLMRSSVDDAVDLLRSREQIVYPEPLRSLTLPALLIHGDNDRIVPMQSSRTLAEQLPRAELQVLAGLGHVPIVTAPAQVAALIDNFGTRLSLKA